MNKFEFDNKMKEGLGLFLIQIGIDNHLTPEEFESMLHSNNLRLSYKIKVI